MNCNRILDTYNRPYAQGTVNPVERETITYLLVVNSKFRPIHNSNIVSLNCDSFLSKKMFASQSSKIKDLIYSKEYPELYTCARKTELSPLSTNSGYVDDVSDFTIELQEPFVNVISLKFSGIEMKKSYYPISDYLGTNVFTIRTFTYNSTDGTVSDVKENIISLSEGAYTVFQLLDAINGILLSSDDATVNAVELKYDCLTGKYRFVVKDDIDPPAGTKYGFQLCFSNPYFPSRKLYYNLGWMMGFRNLVYTMNENYNLEGSPTLREGMNAEAPANLKGTSYFFIEVNDFNNNNPPVINYNCNTEYSFNLRNILAKIPNTPELDYIVIENYVDNTFKKRQYFGPVRIQKLKFRILDDNGRQVDLNHSDYTLNIEVETLNQLC